MESVNEIIEGNERAVAVFTTHEMLSSNLRINGDNTGYTGDWVLRRNPNVDCVVIYHRQDMKNNIYKADITSIEGPLREYPDCNRYKIHFRNLQHCGVTLANWPEFADCGANPVRYLNT